MSISFSSKGDFKSTTKFLKKISEKSYYNKLVKYGKKGVQALAEATPKDSGKTAESWGYVIEDNPGNLKIYWVNGNINKYVNIAIILQYGHGTRNGGWVEGRDYINPAIQPIFDEIAESIWKEVTST